MKRIPLSLPKPNRRAEKKEKVDEEARRYTRFRQSVFKADGYRCANPRCLFVDPHDIRALAPHHIWKRGRCGPDELEWCITLCPICHSHAEERHYDGKRWWTALEFQIWILDQIRGRKNWRFDNAYEYLTTRRHNELSYLTGEIGRVEPEEDSDSCDRGYSTDSGSRSVPGGQGRDPKAVQT